MFIFLNHPLSIGIILILQTFLFSFFAGIIMPSFWYSYILILIFLGGLLILFIYVSSIASNEQILNKPLLTPFMIILVWFSILALFLIYDKQFIINDNILERYSPKWIFRISLSIISLFLIIYLFIVLLAIVKITKWWGGSIRPIGN